MKTKAHYANHLSHFYSWMAGDFETKALEQKSFFQRNHILPATSKVALDLGAGHGLQAIPLAELGYTVKAIDFSPTLLQELNERKGSLDVETIESDLSDLGPYRQLQPGLIVCMGDTIAHLESFEQLEALSRQAYDILAPGGRLVYSFRDYSHPLEDIDRFIPVKNDKNRIHTCMLEYLPQQIRVTDLLHDRVAGQWQQKVSSYLKLRLTPDLVKASVTQAGFSLLQEETFGRMIYLIALKQA